LTVVVSDTSPIRALWHVGELELLRQLFGQVLLPPAVVAELASSKGRLRPLDAGSIPFLRVVAPGDRNRVEELLVEVHLGEAEA
jgi:hypothetical protein